MLETGAKAPDFSLLDDEGNKRTLTEFTGKTLVLWFYPKADTPGCTIEGKGFRDLKADFDQRNVVLCGVSFDDVAANRAFREKCEFPYSLLCDTDKQLAIACGAAADASAGTAKRITVVVGPDGNVRKVYDTVKPAEHPKQVLDDLATL